MYGVKLFRYILIAICQLSLMACSSNPRIEVTPDMVNSTVESSNLSPALEGFSMCSDRYCWNSIIPGDSTEETARATVETLFGVSNIRLREGSIEADANPEQNPTRVGISSDAQRTVSQLSLGFLYQTLTLREVIDWIGEPSFVYLVVAWSSEVKCAGAFITYPGIGIHVNLNPQNHLVGVFPDQFVPSITLLSPEAEENFRVTDTWIVSWQGYTDYCTLTDE